MLEISKKQRKIYRLAYFKFYIPGENAFGRNIGKEGDVDRN